jgi:hypothetical protein
MPAVVQQNQSLTITIDGVDHSCQFVVSNHTPRGDIAVGDPIYTACGDTIYGPTEPELGSLSGTILHDTTNATPGITLALDDAIASNATVVLALTYEPNDAAKTVVWTHNAKVLPFSWDFERPGYMQGTVEFTLLDAARNPAPA